MLVKSLVKKGSGRSGIQQVFSPDESSSNIVVQKYRALLHYFSSLHLTQCCLGIRAGADVNYGTPRHTSSVVTVFTDSKDSWLAVSE